MRANSASDGRLRQDQQDGKKKTKPPQLHGGPMELSPGLLLVEDAPESHLVSVKNLQFHVPRCKGNTDATTSDASNVKS